METIVLSKSTALNIADILQSWVDTQLYYREDVLRYIKELRGEL
jgi:hypothetical protein